MIATLNDDTEPDQHWLERLVAIMRSNPQIGMCASRIEVHGTGKLDSAGMLICCDGSSKQRGQLQPGRDWLDSGDALLPSGCAALYRRELLDDVGLFDEDFFLYCEDTDLGLRAVWAGWQCRYVADAVVQHHYSRTAGAFSTLKAKYVERNRLWVAIRNFPAAWLVMVPFATVVRYLWQLRAILDGRGAASGFVTSGNSMGNIVGILAAAWWETLVSLPALLRERSRCRERHRIPRSQFCRVIGRHRISLRDLAYSG
jgi:GT2 family glycosyltransferase